MSDREGIDTLVKKLKGESECYKISGHRQQDSRGLGQSIAMELAEKGAKIVVNYAGR